MSVSVGGSVMVSEVFFSKSSTDTGCSRRFFTVSTERIKSPHSREACSPHSGWHSSSQGCGISSPSQPSKTCNMYASGCIYSRTHDNNSSSKGVMTRRVVSAARQPSSKAHFQSDIYFSAVYEILSTPWCTGGGHSIMNTCAM